MGNFINTSYNNTIDSIIKGSNQKLNNPYYNFTDKKPTPVVYYNINTKMTTLDEGTKQVESPLGKNSPIKFNKINDALLYGDLPKALLDVQVGDFGTEAASIEGELYVLPNTFLPYQDDYFYIKYLEKDILFRVTGVTPDTLENGSNFYKISIKLDQYDRIIEDQVIDTYNMVINNIGTDFNAIVLNDDYNLILGLEEVLDSVKKYYCGLFYNDKVQTFTYVYDDTHFYDACMIEFMIKNKIFSGMKQYLYISHQLYINKTFPLEYDKTIFRQLEIKNKNLNLNTAYATLIQDPMSLLSTRYENYYKVSYDVKNGMYSTEVPVIDPELISSIKENKLYPEDSENKFYNIIIDYFNKDKLSIDSKVLKMIEDIDYKQDIILFYTIPMIIFIVENSIRELLIKKDGDYKWNGSVD